MRIGLDFDETYTLDPMFWDQFIQLAEGCGHVVVVVTCRRNTPENREVLDVALDGRAAIFTDLGSKVLKMNHLGLPVDVWIDDDPACVIRGK